MSPITVIKHAIIVIHHVLNIQQLLLI